MKLLNDTDKKTEKQVQYGLVDRGIAVEGELLLPGKTLDVADEHKARVEAEHAHLFEVGALCWKTELPNALVTLKADAPTDTEEPKFVEEESPKNKKG